MADRSDDRGRETDRLLETTAREYGYDGQEGAALVDWQTRLRDELATTLGFPVVRGDGVPDLESRRLETVTMDGYERQEWSVRTEAGFRVPFYLLLPDDAEAPHPVVFTIHGHNETGKELAAGEFETDAQREEVVDERRDLAVQAVERGYAAVAPTMRAFGELAGPERDDPHSCTTAQKHAQLFGRTLMGDRTWDVLRLLEFVASRADLDDDRIAITGHSGGAAVATFAAALDERFAVAAPNAFFCTFEDSILAIDHCECNYVPGILRLGEMWDIAGLIAPRPFLAATGADDPIFPLEGTRRAFSELREIYRAAGAPEGCDLHVGEGEHRFYPDGVWPFIEAHLSLSLS